MVWENCNLKMEICIQVHLNKIYLKVKVNLFMVMVIFITVNLKKDKNKEMGKIQVFKFIYLSKNIFYMLEINKKDINFFNIFIIENK